MNPNQNLDIGIINQNTEKVDKHHLNVINLTKMEDRSTENKSTKASNVNWPKKVASYIVVIHEMNNEDTITINDGNNNKARIENVVDANKQVTKQQSKSYMCTKCNKGYKYKGSLTNHIKTLHPCQKNSQAHTSKQQTKNYVIDNQILENSISNTNDTKLAFKQKPKKMKNNVREVAGINQTNSQVAVITDANGHVITKISLIQSEKNVVSSQIQIPEEIKN